MRNNYPYPDNNTATVTACFLGEYHGGDVAVINGIIQNSNLSSLGWTANDPGSWPASGTVYVVWNDDTPKRVTELSLENVDLTGLLDLSGLDGLTILDCTNNALCALDVSGCGKLQNLWCFGNGLTTLNVTGCEELRDLWCQNNNLTMLDVSGCTLLALLFCYNNPFQSLKLPGGDELSVALEPAGSGTVMFSHAASLSFIYYKAITLTAAPNFGCGFVRWTEGAQVSTDAAYAFTLTGSRNLVAEFRKGGGISKRSG